MKKKEGIEYLEKNQDEESSRYIFFLHGYGANAQDLSGFHTLKLSRPCRWIFPNGPLELDTPYNLFGGRAWFPLKIKAANNQLHTNEQSLYYLKKHCQQLLHFISSFKLYRSGIEKRESFRDSVPRGEEKKRPENQALVEAGINQMGIKSDQIILGGFSQGAIMALNTALRMNPPPLALVLMSGAFFPAEILDKNKQMYSKGGRFFQCHGKTDPLLSYSESKEVHSFLQDLQWKGKFLSFEGGHEIPHVVLLQIQEFINHTLS
ncbi:MAG: hypothetical protein OXM55_05215 [Bdellovibrionales bacterium]|nr:hypothetical protein [Bdellovibrionales bacterium]